MTTTRNAQGDFTEVAFEDGSKITSAAGILSFTPGNGTGARKMPVQTGAAGLKGTATLVNGTVTVSNTAVKTGDIIICSHCTPSATALGVATAPIASIVDSTSFIITAKKPADGTTETSDVSTVNWWIVR